jgi:hypothetical protein
MRAGQVVSAVVGGTFLVLGLIMIGLMAEAFSLYNACVAATNCSVSAVGLGPLVFYLVFGVVAVVIGVVLVALGLRLERPVAAPGIVACRRCGRRYRAGQAKFCLACGSPVG